MVEPVQSSRLVPRGLNRPRALRQGDPRPQHARLRSRRQFPLPAMTREKLAKTLAIMREGMFSIALKRVALIYPYRHQLGA